VVSYADGTVEGPDASFADMHLSQIQYAGRGKYLGETITHALVSMAGKTTPLGQHS
jgi:hypothetical protein